MTNVPNYQPKSSGGMPKWLIILLVIGLVIVLGCCGIFSACFWLGKKASDSVQAKIREAEKSGNTPALAPPADDQQKLNDAKKTLDGMIPRNSPNIDVRAPDAPLNPLGRGNDAVQAVKMPANFPDDIPVHDTMVATAAFSDKIKGNGSVVFSAGTTVPDALSDFYEKQMTDKGWKEESNTAINGNYIQSYSKDDRKASISIVTEGAGKKTTVSIGYEKN